MLYGDYTYHEDHWVRYRSFESLCCIPETIITLHVTYNSIKKSWDNEMTYLKYWKKATNQKTWKHKKRQKDKKEGDNESAKQPENNKIAIVSLNLSVIFKCRWIKFSKQKL